MDALDPDYVARTLSNPPFVSIPGVYNVRCLGNYRTQHSNEVTRANFMFRAGEVSGITDDGKHRMHDLGITTVYDLRSDTEILKYNTPTPCIDGVEIVHVPVFEKKDYSPEMMARIIMFALTKVTVDGLRRFQLYASGKTEAFMQLYSEILDSGGPAFGTILRHVRDRPQDSLVFHCTAGKDRTGIVAAILLLLAGVDEEIIATDYSLTRVGREPAREMVMARLEKEPIFAENQEAALNMFSSRHETMIAFLRMFKERYGGAEEYARTYCGLSDDDIGIIRRHIVAPVDRA